MKICHLMYCPFTGLGLHNGFRGNTWLRSRIEIFKRFVIPSLQAQTNKNFVVWISWRPEERHNKQVKELEAYMQTTGLKSVFTYHGVCFWDDKYPDDEAYSRLISSVHQSIGALTDTIGDSDLVYMTIQPSDDMYANRAVENLQAVSPVPSLMGWRKGFIMSYRTKEVAEYNPTTNPPFFTFVFPRAIFVDPFKHLKYTGAYKSHEYCDVAQKYVEMAGRGYMVGTHGENISTTFNIPFKGATVSPAILEFFGIADAKPLETRLSSRVIIRSIINALPVSITNQLKKLYHVFK